MGERAIRYLLLTNSGGAIAVLGFLGGSPAAISLTSAKIALLFFVIGVVLVGVTTAKQYHEAAYLYEAWQSDVDDYYASKINWTNLRSNDDSRIVVGHWDYVLPYSAFVCFILGSLVGSFGLFL
jgi:hypothetical protein